jgi:hypothetical protein
MAENHGGAADKASIFTPGFSVQMALALQSKATGCFAPSARQIVPSQSQEDQFFKFSHPV